MVPVLALEVVVRKESSTMTFWAGVPELTRTLTREAGRLRKQFLRGWRETVAGVAGGDVLRAAACGITGGGGGSDCDSGGE